MTLGAKVKLARGEIHVWRGSLEVASHQFDEFERTLSVDEISRARRFHFERDRRSFIARRGILRSILATYLESKPSELRFLYNEFGKPRLEVSTDLHGLSFNQSHSRGQTLIAVAVDRQVGVDIEFIDNSVACNELATRFFARNEIAALEVMPESAKVAGFFRCWARKEAYVKAREKGLSIPLDSFDVSLNQEKSSSVSGSEDSEVSKWKIEDLDVDSRYACAIAAADCDWKVAQIDWHPGRLSNP